MAVGKVMLSERLGDSGFGRLMRAAGVLLSSQLVSSMFALLALALTGRSLGPTQFGVLVLVQTYVAVVDQLFSFQSWQALIRYGAEFLERGRLGRFSRLVRFTWTLDIAAAIAGGLTAAALASFAGEWLGWDGTRLTMAIVYSVVIAFNLTGTPIGILRLFGRFDLLAIQQIGTAAARLVGVAVAAAAGAGIKGFLGVWMLTTVAGYLLLVMLAAQELRRRKVPILVPGAIRQTLQECPGILTFMGMCNLQSTVRMGNREVDTLVIGASIGLAGAGLYKVVKQFSAVVGMLSDPVFHAVYPEMARMWARGDLRPFQRITVQVMLLSGAVALGIWLAFLVLGRWILEVTVGEAFLPAFPSMVWYLGATVVALFASPLGPALLAAGRPLASFWMTVLGTVVYFTVLFALLGPLGLVAPGIAALCFYLVWFATMSALLLHALRRARDFSPQGSIDGDWSHTCAPRT